MSRRLTALSLLIVGLAVAAAPALASDSGSPAPPVDSDVAWWIWPLTLFVLTFVMGILGVMAGVGGGVLFVPIVSGFLPFHLDFVRACGLMMALSGALSASPSLMRASLASLRLAMPVVLIVSASSIGGALVGLALPAQIVQTALGFSILAIVGLMLTAKGSEHPDVKEPDCLARAFLIHGVYTEASNGERIEWTVHRTPQAMVVFVGVGFVAGMFGLGAGWANVPVLNLLMGAPLKVSVATSTFVLSNSTASAAWVYLNRGCVIPLICVPSMAGIMLGSRIGVRILRHAKPVFIRRVVMVLLFFAGLKSLTKGLGLPFIF